METAIERTKNLLIDQITGPSNDKKSTQMRRVRMSFQPLPAGENDQGLQSERSGNGRETLGEYLRRNSSSRASSMSSTSSSRRASLMPDFLLSSLNDKKLLMNHVSLSIFVVPISQSFAMSIPPSSECALGRNWNHKPRTRSRLKLIAPRRSSFSLRWILVSWIQRTLARNTIASNSTKRKRCHPIPIQSKVRHQTRWEAVQIIEVHGQERLKSSD